MTQSTMPKRTVHDLEFVRKAMKVAASQDCSAFPHDTDKAGKYIYAPGEWWTSGFFPGTLWAIYERSLKTDLPFSKEEILEQANRWADAIAPQQYNKDTHDIGFLIMPSFGRMHQLTGDEKAKQIIVNAAESLLTRYSTKTTTIRSWNIQKSKAYTFDDMDKYYLVIIDNMMNLDLLYYATEITGDKKYADVATTHAERSLDLFFRPDNSTYHLVVLDSQTGKTLEQITHQGYADDSCWARGQAWALYGYASCYKFTGNEKFLDAAKRAADYFVSRLGPNGEVAWDFDAPDGKDLWDVSAATIAASGMLLIQELDKSTRYQEHIDKIINTVLEKAVDSEYDPYLKHSTVNNNKDSLHGPNADTGLVYADYYFAEVGNRLL